MINLYDSFIDGGMFVKTNCILMIKCRPFVCCSLRDRYFSGFDSANFLVSLKKGFCIKRSR